MSLPSKVIVEHCSIPVMSNQPEAPRDAHENRAKFLKKDLLERRFDQFCQIPSDDQGIEPVLDRETMLRLRKIDEHE